MPTLTVRDQDDVNVKGRVSRGLNICDALKSLGQTPAMNCGGNAKCATCKVLVLEGDKALGEITEKESKRLKSIELEKRYRLGCQAIILDDVVISQSQHTL
ncbi:MAG: (2Fe-2S)-binding protein [Spirochaetota bacterium]|nr:(2Fe-2S)-binding protein [Spirochaetota bacterium]